ncbi:MAG: flagellar biosynthetic protein FliO [Clostridia bacterium]|jgi:flagellar protein FliO/FliZ|nr:flagellar biosynthetic protein FliO [Clostridia bacterium]
MQIQDFLDMILLLGIFIGVLFLTYFATKKMATLNKKMAFNKNMQVVEVLQLAQGRYLFIVKVGKQYHLLGAGKESVNYCTLLDENKLNLEVPEQKHFHEYLSYFVKGKEGNDHDEK